MPNYAPPFTLNNKILSLVADISNKVGRLSVEFEQSQLRLRKVNRMRTIQGSLAIEDNTLAEEQISAVIELDRLPVEDVSDGVKQPKLPALQVQIINILKADPQTTVLQLVVTTGKLTRTIERHLKNLREKHMLERIGPDKTGYWNLLL